MFNLSIFRQLLPDQQRQSLESALALLQELSLPAIAAEAPAEVMDAEHFNRVQRELITALDVLYREIDAVEIVLRQAAERSESGLLTLARDLDGLYERTVSIDHALAHREHPAVAVALTEAAREPAVRFYANEDLATLTAHGLTTQRASHQVQSSYSGIPAAKVRVNSYPLTLGGGTTIDVPCRIGLPLAVTPYRQRLQNILNTDGAACWSEHVLSPQLLTASRENVPWLVDTNYQTGAAIQLRIDFETATHVSSLQLVPFSPLPMTYLAVDAYIDGQLTRIWEAGDERLDNQGLTTLLFGDTPIIARTFLVTLAQEHARQLVHSVSQRAAQDLKYWQTAGADDAPAELASPFQALNTDDVTPALVPLDALEATESTSIYGEWIGWSTQLVYGLEQRGLALPDAQRRAVLSVGEKFGRIAAVLTALATPSGEQAATVQYEYVYGFKRMTFLYEEFDAEGRFVTKPLAITGDLRQVRVAAELTPADAEITRFGDGDLLVSATLTGVGNLLTLDPESAADIQAIAPGMSCAMETAPNTIFTVNGVGVDVDAEQIVLDRSYNTAFPQETASPGSAQWRFWSDETRRAARRHATFSLVLRDDNALAVPVYPDAWTTIAAQTDTPIHTIVPHSMAVDDQGNVYVSERVEAGGDRLFLYRYDGVTLSLGVPDPDAHITDMLIAGNGNLLVRLQSHAPTETVGARTYHTIALRECTSIYSNDDPTIGDVDAQWADVLPVEFTLLSYPEIVRGVAYYRQASDEQLLLQGCTAPGAFVVYSLSRAAASAGGTRYTAAQIEKPASATAGFESLPLASLAYDGTLYYAAKGADARYAVPNGIYRFDPAEIGLDPKPVLYHATMGVLDAFTHVDCVRVNTGTRVIGVTDAGRVLGAVYERIPSNRLLATVDLSVTEWDDDTLPASMVRVGDTLYVVDNGNHCLKCFAVNDDEQVYTYIGWIGFGVNEVGVDVVGFHSESERTSPRATDKPGGFAHPRGIAAGPDGYLYVADTDNHRVQVLDSDGNFCYWLGADAFDGVIIHNDTAISNPKLVKVSSQLFGLTNEQITAMQTGYYHGSITQGQPDGWDGQAMAPNQFYALHHSYRDQGGGREYFYGATSRVVIDTVDGIQEVTLLEAVGGADISDSGAYLFDLFAPQRVGRALVIDRPFTVTLTARLTGLNGNHEAAYLNLLEVELCFGRGMNENNSGLVDELTISLGKPGEAILNHAAYHTMSALVTDIDWFKNGYTHVALRFKSAYVLKHYEHGATRLYREGESGYTGLWRIGAGPMTDHAWSMLIKSLTVDLDENPATRLPSATTADHGFISPAGVHLARVQTGWPNTRAYPYNTPTCDLLCVTDTARHVVQVIGLVQDPASPLLMPTDDFSSFVGHAGIFGAGGIFNVFSLPSSVLLVPDGETLDAPGHMLYIADTRHHRVLALPLDGDADNAYTVGHREDGSYVTAGVVDTQASKDVGGFMSPSMLGYAVRAHAPTLFVGDNLGRIQPFLLDALETAVDEHNSLMEARTGAASWKNPSGFLVTDDDAYVVLDSGNDRIQVISSGDTYQWVRTTLQDGDGAPVNGAIIADGPTPRYFVCQRTGLVAAFSYDAVLAQWQKQMQRPVGSGFQAIALRAASVSQSDGLYAISAQRYIYRALSSGYWQWLRNAHGDQRLYLQDATDTFTATSADGEVTLSDWPFIDWEGIYSYHHHHYPATRYNPNDATQPVMRPFDVEILLADGTVALSDQTGEPSTNLTTARFQTVPTTVNDWGDNSARLAALAPYILSPVTLVDESTLENYRDTLQNAGVALPTTQQTSLSFSRIIGRRVFKSRFKNWVSDPNFKLGIILTDPIDGQDYLYYAESATRRVANLPNIDVIPREGLLILREELPRFLELYEDGAPFPRTVEVFDEAIRLVVFDFFAPDAVVAERDATGAIRRDANGEFVYRAISTRAVPYTANMTDYLTGVSLDVANAPYNASVPVDNSAYNPIFFYTQHGKTLRFNTVFTPESVRKITVRYKTLALRPRLVIDLTRDGGRAASPVLTACDLYVGSIIP